jgi:hypothetical protein
LRDRRSGSRIYGGYAVSASTRFGIALLLLVPAPALAGSYDEAEAALSQGYHQIFDSFANGSAQSPEARRSLVDRVLAPVSQQMNQAITDNARANLAASGVKVNTGSGAGSDRSPGSSGSMELGGPAVPGAAPRGPAPSSGGPGRPEYVLDGSQVPRELEFPGPPKKPAPSAPVRRAAPRQK